jgi:hypothetical protein
MSAAREVEARSARGRAIAEEADARGSSMRARSKEAEQ